MARKARVQSESGFYYVEVNGNNRVIFIEDDDYRRFISMLTNAAADDLAEVCAYCLLSERISLVIKEGLGGLSAIMRKVISEYVGFYNQKYSRSGKLTRDRFKSEPLESEEEILDAVRFVHRIPLKENVSGGLKYLYSSYNLYDKGAEGTKGSAVMLLCADSPQSFRLEMEKEAEFGKRAGRPSDSEVVALLKEYLRGLDKEQIEEMGEEREAQTVRYLHSHGVSIRRLATLLGVGKGTIEKALKGESA